MNIEIIILTAVAVFVISRLYSVLGQKTGAEPPARSRREAMRRAPEASDDAAEPAAPAKLRPAFTGEAASGLEAIASVDPTFSPDEFVRGARRAYELIVAAFADGDREALKSLVDQDVFEAYSDAISAREATPSEPMRLLRIRKASIAEAELVEGRTGLVSVSFEAELSDGETTREAREIWTFKRTLSSKDPNWLLDEVAAMA
ncbi:MAG: 39S ribosomal protein L45 [Alphaproteobacteria bacterium]|nr:39S ribosomal protein L45 [Alphaproteobacteria bacterium]